MRQEDIEERLVDWELARQRGEEPDSAELFADSGPWQHYLEQRLEVLRKTSWMLDDPAPGPLDPQISKLVSEAAVTVRNSEVFNNTPSSELANDRTGAVVDGAAGRGLPQQMPDVPGFSYISQLGKGGFGVVFRALDETLQRHVAIKFPLIDGKRERQKYIAEARNASRVDVPGIVPIYYVGETSAGTPYVIQKLIEGKSLREILKLGGCLSPSQAAELFARICQAAAAAHALALVHRDLKPENVLVDHQGLPWITDFGLSVAEDDPNLHAASVAGTPNFMSPEQIMGKVEWLDGRCDIWALGVMLYQCLTGRLPFHSSNNLDLQDKILNFEPRPIAQRQPNLRGDWDKIFRKCCAKSISERYNNTLEMADDLTQLSRGLEPEREKHNAVLLELQASALGRSRISTSTAGRSAWPSLRLSPVAGLALGALTLVLVVLAVVLFRQSYRTQEFVVSRDGTGTHRSIQAALEAASATTSIFIEPGVYRESLVVARKATLRGRGPQQQIQIIGLNAPTFTVDIGGQLSLHGLSIAVDEKTQGVWNVIDVTGGSVMLDTCKVSADQFDCVHMQAESNLLATSCDFQTAQHPAIFAELANEVVVRDCRFQMGLENASNQKFLAGLQIIQSGGSVSNCTFSGRAAVGIDWSAAQSLVTIDDCKFQNLDRALIATACQELRIGGLGRMLFENCGTAIELTGCGAAIKNCNIDSHGRMDGRGILVHGLNDPDWPIEFQSCQIGGAVEPMVVSQSKVIVTSLTIDGCANMGFQLLDNSYLELTSSQIRNCEVAGMLLEESRASLQRCTLTANKAAGVVVDGLEDAFFAKSCLIDDNEVGIIILSGAARLEYTNIRRATTGILLARRHLLSFAATCDAQLALQALGGSVEARQNAIQFLSPGSYSLSDCQTSDPNNRPVLEGNLERVAAPDSVVVRLRQGI